MPGDGGGESGGECMVCSPGGRLDGGFPSPFRCSALLLPTQSSLVPGVEGKPEKWPQLLVLIGKIN